MPQDKVKRIHLIYGIIASVLIVALGVALIVACRGIYTSGPRPYTRDAISAKLQDMAVLLWLNLGAVLGGIVLNIVLPLPRIKTKAIRDELVTMQKLAAKAGVPNEKEKTAIEKFQRKRWLYPVLTAGIFGGLVSRPAFYLLDRSNFPAADPTAEIMAAAIVILPPIVIGLLLCFICSLLVKKCILRETEVYKYIIASGNKATPAPAPNTDKPTLLKTVRIAVFAVALVFIVVGIFNGSANDVLTKAIKICTECIGLG